MGDSASVVSSINDVADARVCETVMMTSYVKETDEELRARSNRTYFRILASLPGEVARRYGHADDDTQQMERLLRAAMAAKDWERVAELSSTLAKRSQP